MSQDCSGMGSVIPPRPEVGFTDPPEVINNVANPGVINNAQTFNTTVPTNALQPQQQQIKITPPPPRFVQGKMPTATPMAFTVLGAGKMVLLIVKSNEDFVNQCKTCTNLRFYIGDDRKIKYYEELHYS